MNNCKHILSFLCILFTCLYGYTQEEPVVENEIQVISRVQPERILIRWAPLTPSIWLKSNTHGYNIERYTIYRDGQRLAAPEKKIVTPAPLKPEPLEQWEEIATNNDYAAILAQALYGDSFDVEGSEEQGSLLQIINQAEEIEQRFSFALFAADMNFEAAKKAALGFEDKDIKSNERYYYRIISAIPEEIAIVKEGAVYVDAGKIEELPAPIDLIAVNGDKNIMLTWEYELFKFVYTSYFVERSEDGNNFKRLGDTPLVNLNDKPEAPAKRMYYIDTLAQNNKKYYYRVLGVSPFGEEGQPSDVVSGQGTEELTFTPHIRKYELLDNGGARIEWEFPKEGEKAITGFHLNWSTTAKGPYKTVKENIAAQQRSTSYDNLSPSNYFTVTAVANGNKSKTSMATFVQTIDSIPPAAPVEVKGVIDSLGVVKLSWKPNEEPDILGYRVFRGNLEGEELSQLTESPVEINNYTDTVTIASLNSKVYYSIVAVDKRFNMSAYSEKLTLKKPDVVPPSSPVFSKYEVIDGTVVLNWINSTSDDVQSHKLFRQDMTGKNTDWQRVFVTDTLSTFTDTDVLSNNTYRYAIFAVDESELLSKPSTPLTISVTNMQLQNTIKGFTLYADFENQKIDLSWAKLPPDVTEILIYKAKEDEKPVLLRQIPVAVNKVTRFEDKKVNPGNRYEYAIKALKQSGEVYGYQSKQIEY